jgi:signal transduction histidine kinase
VASSPEARSSTTTALDQVLALVDESHAGAAVPAAPRRAARDNAVALLHACGGTPDALTLAIVGYAGELLGSIAADLAADPRQLRRLADDLQARASVPRVALGRELLRAGPRLELPVQTAVEVQLALLLAFTGADAVSLWAREGDAEPRHVAHSGELHHGSAQTLAAARAVLEADRHASVAGQATLGLRIDALRPPAGAVIAHGVAPGAADLGPLLAAAGPSLAGLLERQSLLGREQSQDSVNGAVERRLARLRFDLHDGPQQDVHLLAQDLQLFRDQLRPMISGDPDEHRALGRLDDLEAQLVALDDDLRRLSTSVQSPFLVPGTLGEALAQLAGAFTERTGIRPETDFGGDLTQLSDSQQIALLALIRESLSNIRKHSDASTVAISIVSDLAGVTVEIRDDGSGFDPEATLVRAAGAGRLGLVGMQERVRMLGGRTRIDSRPGGPTVISATLPRWTAEAQ